MIFIILIDELYISDFFSQLYSKILNKGTYGKINILVYTLLLWPSYILISILYFLVCRFKKGFKEFILSFIISPRFDCTSGTSKDNIINTRILRLNTYILSFVVLFSILLFLFIYLFIDITIYSTKNPILCYKVCYRNFCSTCYRKVYFLNTKSTLSDHPAGKFVRTHREKGKLVYLI